MSREELRGWTDIEFGVHAGPVVTGDVAEQFVASRREVRSGPPAGPWGYPRVSGVLVTLICTAGV